MLLAVEGGGFFSASASGYSKFLSLLISYQKNEESPMRVSPWSHYHLVEHKADSYNQLASKKNVASSGCSSCFCFGRPSSCHDANLPPKVGPLSQSDFPSGPSSASETRNDSTTCGGNEENRDKTFVKSIIKKRCPLATRNANMLGKADETETVIAKNIGDRKVQWTDACGGELVEIREFQPSEEGPLGGDSKRSDFKNCVCVIQ